MTRPTVTLHIELPESRTVYRCGESVVGTVVVHAESPVRCDALKVRLWWRAGGPQDDTDHVDIADEVIFERYGELCGRGV